eukprot:121199-Pyramimonas_sp.AAC.1
MSLSSQHPHMYDEHPSAWVCEKHPITEEEARGYMSALTSLRRNDWVLEQRRRRGTHGNNAVRSARGIWRTPRAGPGSEQ